MKYKTKSILIGRKKRDDKAKKEDSDERPCFIALFEENSPHTTGTEPKEILEYSAHRIILKNAGELSYLLAGNDILVNDLEEIDVEFDSHGHVVVSVKQKRI